MVFECITSYFTEIFYVHCYNEAKKLKEDHKYPQINSITVGYKHSLRAWEHARKEKKFYKESIKGIVEKLKLEMGGMASYSMAITVMVRTFIPDPCEWRDLSPEEQNNMLGTVIQNCVKQFILKIMNTHVVMIIDKRNKNTIEIIQDSFLQIIMDIKEYTESHIRLTMQADNPKKRNVITQETYHRMKNFCKNLIIENKKYVQVINKLQNIIRNRKEEFDTLKEEVLKLKLEREVVMTTQKSQAVTESDIVNSSMLPLTGPGIPPLHNPQFLDHSTSGLLSSELPISSLLDNSTHAEDNALGLESSRILSPTPVVPSAPLEFVEAANDRESTSYNDRESTSYNDRESTSYNDRESTSYNDRESIVVDDEQEEIREVGKAESVRETRSEYDDDAISGINLYK